MFETKGTSLIFCFLLCLIHFALFCGGNHLKDTHCQYINDNYVCEDIPKHIPHGVTSVVVTGFQGVSLSHKLINDTWRQVQRLELTANHVTQIRSGCFVTLGNLTVLTLIMQSVEDMDTFAFMGLHNLKTLEMLQMAMLKSSLISALTIKLTALQNVVFNPGQTDLPPTIQILPPATQLLLENTLLKSVNVSNSLIVTTLMEFVRMTLSDIEVFNISGSTVIFLYPKSQEDNTILLDDLVTRKPFYKTFDISRSTYSNGPLQLEYKSDLKSNHSSTKSITFLRYMTMIEHIYADNIFHTDCIFEAGYNYSGLPTFLKTASFRMNNVVKLRGELILDLNNTVSSVDFSDNKISYIQPEFLITLIYLERLNLSNNYLNKMQYNPRFQGLFKMQRELAQLDMSYNELSFIPYAMFDVNTNLELLVLSFNRLTTVMFNLMRLERLKVLDLSGNRIQVIEGSQFVQLQKYVATRVNSSAGFFLVLNNNPLLCACKSVKFITWLNTMSGFDSSYNVYHCNFEGNVQLVDDSAVEGCKYLCKRTTVIAVSVSLSSVLLTGIVIGVCTFIKLQRKRKLRDLEYQFRMQFNGLRMNKRFIVFVAYASVEEEVVRNHLLSQLNGILKERLGTRRDAIATGYNFRPGFRITEETFRLIKLSHVFLAVVSNFFCRSEYCIAELNEACDQKKPVILVFNGEVDEHNMSPYLKEVFKRVVRAKMTASADGGVDLVPSVKHICESAITLAMAQVD